MGVSKIVYYLGNKDEIVDYLRIYLKAQGLLLRTYSDEVLVTELEYLMLIEPVLLRSKQYILSSLWKNWLLEHHPHCKLIFASYRQTDHPNALNLLQLPVDFSSWLKDIPPVGVYQPQYAGCKEIDGQKYDEYVDPWKFFPLPLGWDIKDEIVNFLDGHNRDNSFVNQLIRLRKSMMDLKDIIEEGSVSHLDLEKIASGKNEIKITWALLNNRWERYAAFFEWLPFHQTVRQLIHELKLLDQHCKALFLDKSNELHPNNQSLDRINRLLDEQIQRYVYYESYW